MLLAFSFPAPEITTSESKFIVTNKWNLLLFCCVLMLSLFPFSLSFIFNISAFSSVVPEITTTEGISRVEELIADILLLSLTVLNCRKVLNSRRGDNFFVQSFFLFWLYLSFLLFSRTGANYYRWYVWR